MVVKDSKSLFSLIDNFDPNNQDHLLKLEELSMNYPNFHLVRAYYLKALQKQEVSSFDKILLLIGTVESRTHCQCNPCEMTKPRISAAGEMTSQETTPLPLLTI